jgi:hypothetical protein
MKHTNIETVNQAAIAYVLESDVKLGLEYVDMQR